MKNRKFEIIASIVIILVITSVMCIYQTKKEGFHEDEVYSFASAVNPTDGLMVAYDTENITEESKPEWKTRESVKDYMTLKKENYLNLKSIYTNQKKDNHPPFFYLLVHFSSVLFNGNFSKYPIFLINIVVFILSCIIIIKMLKILKKEYLSIGVIILYGLSMGTISMVLYQRMYMVLTMFMLLYLYYNIKIYINNFEIDKKTYVKLGIITVLGFLTQYFFAIFAVFVFILMTIEMLREKKYKIFINYLIFHIVYAIIGVLTFIPCLRHLFYTDRGISNLKNGLYLEHLSTYIKHLLYFFTIKDNLILDISILVAIAIGVLYSIIKKRNRFIILITLIPSLMFFLITVKMTSYQEIRYIMPIIPFLCIMFFAILDSVIQIKNREYIFIAIALIISINGLINSKPKFLFEEYKECLDIANSNKEKSFVYVYDNMFNHMQSVPEMMIYKKTLILNVTKNELEYLINDENLKQEEAYILAIKTYMDNEKILKEITSKTEFKNITKLYEPGSSTEKISNILYLVSK